MAPEPEAGLEGRRLLSLHPLIAEDIVEGNQRAKIEATEGLVHIVLFALHYDGRASDAYEIDFVLGERLPSHRPPGRPGTRRSGASLRRGPGRRS